MSKCNSSDGCSEIVVGRGLCRKHYLQAYRAGTLSELPTRQRTAFECPSDHAHDLETCWQAHKCRCERCQHLRKMERQRNRTRLLAHGRGDEIREARVPVPPVRAHLATLMIVGGLDRIADAAGVKRSMVTTVYHGKRGAAAKRQATDTPKQTVAVSVAKRLLAVTPEMIDPAYVDATGTIRRLQALVAIGYSQTNLAKNLSMDVGNFADLIHGKRPRVLAQTYARTNALFLELWARPVDGSRGDQSRLIARKHGWVGPLAWDDLDDPREWPNVDGRKPLRAPLEPEPADPTPKPEPGPIDEIAIELAMQGKKVRLTKVERDIAIARLNAQGCTDINIAGTLHISDRTALRVRQKLGLAAVNKAESDTNAA